MNVPLGAFCLFLKAWLTDLSPTEAGTTCSLCISFCLGTCVKFPLSKELCLLCKRIKSWIRHRDLVLRIAGRTDKTPGHSGISDLIEDQESDVSQREDRGGMETDAWQSWHLSWALTMDRSGWDYRAIAGNSNSLKGRGQRPCTDVIGTDGLSTKGQEGRTCHYVFWACRVAFVSF